MSNRGQMGTEANWRAHAPARVWAVAGDFRSPPVTSDELFSTPAAQKSHPAELFKNTEAPASLQSHETRTSSGWGLGIFGKFYRLPRSAEER